MPEARRGGRIGVDTVIAKLRVCSGSRPAQLRRRILTARPMMPLTCGFTSRAPSVTSVDVSVNQAARVARRTRVVGAGGVGHGAITSRWFAVQEEMLENLGTEQHWVDGYPFVNPVEQGGEIEVARQLQWGESEAPNAQLGERLASVAPDSMYGTVRPSGSWARIAAFIASTRRPSKVVSYGSRRVIHPFDVRTQQRVDLRLKGRLSAGSTRQSTTASACCGITLALYPALSIVGWPCRAASHR